MQFRLSRTGLFFLGVGLAGLALPFVQFKANRILPGDGLKLLETSTSGWAVFAVSLALLAGLSLKSLPAKAMLGAAICGLALNLLHLGIAATGLIPEDNTLARVAPASGFWLLILAFALALAEALNRLEPGISLRWGLLVATVLLLWGFLASGILDDISVMREYRARSDVFARQAAAHLFLAFGSLGLALMVGLPVGVILYQTPRIRRSVLSLLNIMQTIPSLALFGIMIPVFGWIAANIPGAAALGVAGIGVFPALIALFLYALLPVVSNTLTGLNSVSQATRQAAAGLGMTRPQILIQVLVPLALPVLLAAVRIVLVQNIGLAVIAGLIGGGGFGTFVFQGLSQTAMDLVLLGALPTIALALTASIALDLLIEASNTTGQGNRA